MSDTDDTRRERIERERRRLDRYRTTDSGLPAMLGYVTTEPAALALGKMFTMRRVIITGDEVEGGPAILTDDPDTVLTVVPIDRPPFQGSYVKAQFYPHRWGYIGGFDRRCYGLPTTYCLRAAFVCFGVTRSIAGTFTVLDPDGLVASSGVAAGDYFCYDAVKKGTYTVTFVPDSSCFSGSLPSYAIVNDCSLGGTSSSALAFLLTWPVSSLFVTSCCHDDCDCPPPSTLYLSTMYGGLTASYGTDPYLGIDGWTASFTATVAGAEIGCCSGAMRVLTTGSATVAGSYVVRCDGAIFKSVTLLYQSSDCSGPVTGSYYQGQLSVPAGCIQIGPLASATGHASGTAGSQSWCPVNFSASLTRQAVSDRQSGAPSGLSPSSIEETVTVSQ